MRGILPTSPSRKAHAALSVTTAVDGGCCIKPRETHCSSDRGMKRPRERRFGATIPIDGHVLRGVTCVIPPTNWCTIFLRGLCNDLDDVHQPADASRSLLLRHQCDHSARWSSWCEAATAWRPQDACSLCSEPALGKRGGLPLAHDRGRRHPRSRGYRVGTPPATPTDTATAARPPRRCSTVAAPTTAALHR